MRERLQRRKKKPAEPSEQPAPPPLQPAYFEAEQPPGSVPDAGRIESEISAAPPGPAPLQPAPRPVRRVRPSSEDQPSEQQPSEAEPANPQTAPSSSTGRGRRRRGGRGRGGRGREQAVAHAFTPAAVKGSIPVIPVDATEEELAGAGEVEAPSPPPPVVAAARAKLPQLRHRRSVRRKA